jgi:hypothetical protein
MKKNAIFFLILSSCLFFTPTFAGQSNRKHESTKCCRCNKPFDETELTSIHPQKQQNDQHIKELGEHLKSIVNRIKKLEWQLEKHTGANSSEAIKLDDSYEIAINITHPYHICSTCTHKYTDCIEQLKESYGKLISHAQIHLEKLEKEKESNPPSHSERSYPQ